MHVTFDLYEPLVGRHAATDKKPAEAVEYVTIKQHADAKDVVHRAATDADRSRFKTEYAAFRRTMELQKKAKK